ncbi:hypothetical protein AMAG_06403 [Allomyces macrogynus ATCC 38327]|uniref:Diphthamide synthase domain-containing protein n=1 Tax=Allomyces macrogynus (strain ATCC 38327) TaxID=578462 RepID=A0A0L0SGF3_ALLM3|nr:hypothetical protein AMAG_06403 [Allomyces macrogynus ATCC 38327]|eukprot:KNE61591.1 hypothetical protein AMAG_06403 [Allomyces macrogynus ATCC 38327]
MTSHPLPASATAATAPAPAPVAAPPARRRPRLALCFTGGKDSTLVLHLLLHKPNLLASALGIRHARDSDHGDDRLHLPPAVLLPPNHQSTNLAPLYDFEFVALVTFHPKSPRFLAHPLGGIAAQASALHLPLRRVEVIPDPDFSAGYANAICSLDLDVLVTGDMMDVCSAFMRRAAKAAGVPLWCPLWGVDRAVAWDLVLDAMKMVPVVTCVHLPSFAKAWGDEEAAVEKRAREVVGKPVDRDALNKWLVPAAANDGGGVDLCGEMGEFHSMVVDGALFHERVELPGRAELDPQGTYIYWAGPLTRDPLAPVEKDEDGEKETKIKTESKAATGVTKSNVAQPSS